MPRTAKTNQAAREEQRANILRAAEKVFVQSGATATMSEISGEAGISQGEAHLHIAGKEKIRSASESDAIFRVISGPH